MTFSFDNVVKSQAILALDLATSTGWAARTEDGGLESGTVNFKPKRGESDGMRYVRFRSWLNTILDVVKPSLVVYEAPHHRGGAATMVLVGLETRVHEVCATRNIEYTNVKTSTLKKHATGKGNASKAEMMASAETVLGRPPINDDEADAVCVLVWVEDEHGLR